MGEHLLTGQRGEQAALTYLLQCGYRLQSQNWRYKHLEVDLIMYDADVLVFIEVKTRSSGNFGLPFEAVDWKKKRKLVRAANIFIDRNYYQGEIRFDIISIFANESGKHNIRHIKDAFWPQ